MPWRGRIVISGTADEVRGRIDEVEATYLSDQKAGDDPGTVEDDWLGAPMYFSAFDAATNRRLVQDAGLELLSADEITGDEDGVPVTFLWMVARKPTGEASGDGDG